MPPSGANPRALSRSIKALRASRTSAVFSVIIFEKVRAAWGVTIRNGFGQTENVLTLGNFPGQKVKPGAVGKASPGHEVVLLDPEGRECNAGEICIGLEPRPLSLMPGYVDDAGRTARAMEGGYYHTGDVAHCDEDGYFTYVGRSDDVFKSSDYRLSPFELESALIEHPAIAEAAVVPSPDPIRWNVPKAFLTLCPGVEPTRELAKDIFIFVRGRLGPYKRVRRIEFSALPRLSPARSAGCNCARSSSKSTTGRRGARTNIGRKTFRN